jgi:16S rRNA (cytosine967-C5)-methyltransferase
VNDTARLCAIRAMIKFERGNEFSETAVNEMLAKAKLSETDKRFAVSLFYGVLERKITLDYIISLYSKNPIEKIDIEVLCTLRAGLYQILYMDSVPDNAAVNESVEACRNLAKTSAKGFVNAVLRQFLRDRKAYKLPDGMNCLSVKYSVNPDIIQSFYNDYGSDTAQSILEHFSLPPKNYIRLNSVRFTVADLPDGFTPTDIDGCFIAPEGNITNGAGFKKAFAAGMYHVQDYSCAYACKALDVYGNDDVLDLCAAPGGKSFTLAEQTDGYIYACDINEKRVRMIIDGASRLGLRNIKTFTHDGKIFNNSFPTFNRVLCDVPCSGLGVIRKKPEIRYKRMADLTRLPDVQYRILENGVRYLNPGGKLIYSTCTLRKAENDDVITAFQKQYGTAFDVTMKTILPGTFAHDSDGFFVAVITKKA